jgi:hypothetical protein
MKKNRLTTLLIIAIILLLAGVGLLAMRANQTLETTTQTQTLSDWAYGTAGMLKVMVSHPTELFVNQKNTVSLTFEPDTTLEQYLANGYVFDAEFDAAGSVITPRKRIMTPLEKGRQSISWEIVPFTTFEVTGIIKMSLADSNQSGAYAISPQVSLDLAFQVKQTGIPQTVLIVGLITIGLGLFLLLAYIVLKKNTHRTKG